MASFERHYGISKNPFSNTIAAKDAFFTTDFKALTSRMDHLVSLGGIGLFCAAPGYGKNVQKQIMLTNGTSLQVVVEGSPCLSA